MKYIQNTILLIFITIGFSCTIKKQASESINNYAIPEEYITYTKQQKNNILILSNINETTPLQPVKILKIILIDINKNEIILEDQLREGSYEWIDNDLIKFLYSVGNPQKGVDYSYYFDTKLRKKTSNNITQKAK